MMCGAAREQHLALDQRLAHQAKLVIFEIAQAAMDELARARRGAFGEIVLLAQQDGEAAAGGIAGDAGAVDAAADHGEVDQPVIGSAACDRRLSSLSCCASSRPAVAALGRSAHLRFGGRRRLVFGGCSP